MKSISSERKVQIECTLIRKKKRAKYCGRISTSGLDAEVILLLHFRCSDAC